MISNDSPYKNRNIGRMSEKKYLLKALDEDIRKSKLSTRYDFGKSRNNSLPILKKIN